MSAVKMTPFERRAALSLASIFALRMLGLFMILPVFALYAEHLAGVTPLLVGVAIGVYGLTQALLQLPFGMASDRIGRKPVIAVGLLIFALGSVVAAMADTIHGVILGRALQGAGAVAAAIMALAADLTREEHRSKAMAVIGMTIGLSFLLAMVAGPLLGRWIGVPGIFWLTALLALGGIGVLFVLVPTPQQSRFHRDTEPVPAQFGRVLREPELLRLDLGIFVLHMVLTATFIAVPLALRDAGLAAPDHWQLYLPVMVLAMGLAVPFIIIAEAKRRLKGVFVGAVASLLLAQLLLAWSHSGVVLMGLLLLLFFAAFNLLEATLPSLVSKVAHADSKGTAMGVYASSQFMGAFIGGVLGGWAYGVWGSSGVFLGNAALLLLWAVVAATMRPPRYLSSELLRVGTQTAQSAASLEQELMAIPGVVEASVCTDDGVAYLKLDRQLVEMEALQRFSVSES
ncbi:MAG: MFS transporter [Gammaproteobacteria bacterium]|nr:MFS transporter [Gammaproteobacteria bacterium]